jgi:Xaa-Pro aminopeptidase
MDYLPQRQADATRDLDGLDALLITNPTNVRYLSGFTGTSAYLVCSPAKTVLVTDARYSEQAAEECKAIEVVVRPHTQTVEQAAAAALTSLAATSVGLEGSATLGQLHALQQAGPNLTFAPVVGRVEALRAVKDPGEVAAIRHAVRVAERAFRMAVHRIDGRHTEKDVHDLMDACLRRAGATASAFPPITAVGGRAARPHAHPDPAVTVADAGLLLLDWGADCGYMSDLTRTVRTPFAVPAGFHFDEIYGAVCRAHDAAVARIRPGVAATDVDAAARKALADARLRDNPGFDLAACFTHGLGHGLGLDVHELPRVRADSRDVLQAGMVITVEPAVYLPGWGAVRIEDDYLVTADGWERLSSLPREPNVIL